MTWQLLVYICMNILSVAFITLVFIGLCQYIRQKLRLGYGSTAKALRLAALRYVQGEIDAASFRSLRKDLKA